MVAKRLHLFKFSFFFQQREGILTVSTLFFLQTTTTLTSFSSNTIGPTTLIFNNIGKFFIDLLYVVLRVYTNITNKLGH